MSESMPDSLPDPAPSNDRGDLEIPPEVLYQIIAMTCGEYVDTVIMEEPVHPQIGQADNVEPPDIEPDTSEQNPFISLSRTSHQIREITLAVMSRGMSIPRQPDGRLALKPWTMIERLRRCLWKNPLEDIEVKPTEMELASPFCLIYYYLGVSLRLLRSVRLTLTAHDERAEHLASASTEDIRTQSLRLEFPEFSARARFRFWRHNFGLVMLDLILERKLRFIKNAENLSFSRPDKTGEPYKEVVRKIQDNLWSMMNLCSSSINALKSPGYENYKDENSRILDYEIFEIAGYRTLSDEMDELKDCLTPEDLQKCKSMAQDVRTAWAEMYPEILTAQAA